MQTIDEIRKDVLNKLKNTKYKNLKRYSIQYSLGSEKINEKEIIASYYTTNDSQITFKWNPNSSTSNNAVTLCAYPIRTTAIVKIEKLNIIEHNEELISTEDLTTNELEKLSTDELVELVRNGEIINEFEKH